MGKSRIEWCDRVWNVISGCSKVSSGCANCYAERMSKRLAGRYGYPVDDPFRVTLHPERLIEPLSWKKPQRVFVGSMADWLHPDVPTDYIDEILDVISACPQHTFLTLTKRPENLYEKIYGVTLEHGCRELGGGDWLPNLWFGVSVEDQKTADERIPLLLHFEPAAKRFVSCEPLLSEIDLAWNAWGMSRRWLHDLNFLICGAETGPGARPMDLAWARSLRDQCKSAGVPFFFKAVSGKGHIPDDLLIREWPDKEKGE